MMVSPDLLATSQLRKLDYHWLFEPVCYLVSVPIVIAVSGASAGSAGSAIRSPIPSCCKMLYDCGVRTQINHRAMALRQHRFAASKL
jgi:hypothetical protein